MIPRILSRTKGVFNNAINDRLNLVGAGFCENYSFDFMFLEFMDCDWKDLKLLSPG